MKKKINISAIAARCGLVLSCLSGFAQAAPVEAWEIDSVEGFRNSSWSFGDVFTVGSNNITVSATIRNDDPIRSGPLILEVLGQKSVPGVSFYVRLSDPYPLEPLDIGEARPESITGPLWWPPEDRAYDVVLWLREFVGQPAEFVDGTIVRAQYSLGSREFVAPSSHLENPAPDSHQSGIGIISGWSCISSRVSVSIDDRDPIPVAYGTSRNDTANACSGETDTGFGLLLNFNLLGGGTHTAQLWAAGWKRGDPARFTVTVPGGEFMTGIVSSVIVPNFPSPGRNARLVWQESQQNFVIESTSP